MKKTFHSGTKYQFLINLLTCKSRSERYVLPQPLFPYLLPPWVHIKRDPRLVSSTRTSFSLQRGHSVLCAFAQLRQKTCLQGICK